MRRFIKVVTCMALITALLVGTTTVQASLTLPENSMYGEMLRVGLTSKYGNLWSITLQNTSLIAGYERDGRFFGECVLASQKGLVAAADSSYFVRLGGYNSYQEAKNYADALRQGGYGAAPCLTGVGTWAVYVGGYENAQLAQSAITNLGGQVVAPNGRRVVLTENNVLAAVFDSPDHFPQFAAGDGGQVSLGDRKYRGRVEITRPSGTNLTAVNVCGLEEYLFSVVPSEMPPKWNAEALKAQAVACRSYTLTRREVHSVSGYGLCDGAHCQVYLGAGNETDTTNAAVNATRDIMLWHGGQVVAAVYHSSSGGSTDHSENVWNSAEPFLRGVKEVSEYEPKVWSRTVTLSDLTAALNAAGAGIGSATGMFISKTDNGRAQELVITGTAGQKAFTKEAIRSFFQSTSGGSLDSRNFTISAGTGGSGLGSSVSVAGYKTGVSSAQYIGGLYVLGGDGIVRMAAAAGDIMNVRSCAANAQYTASTTASQAVTPGTFVLNGTGSGHGVGMSQHGAQGLAELGWTYDRILKHYYTGAEVHK